MQNEGKVSARIGWFLTLAVSSSLFRSLTKCSGSPQIARSPGCRWGGCCNRAWWLQSFFKLKLTWALKMATILDTKTVKETVMSLGYNWKNIILEIVIRNTRTATLSATSKKSKSCQQKSWHSYLPFLGTYLSRIKGVSLTWPDST